MIALISLFYSSAIYWVSVWVPASTLNFDIGKDDRRPYRCNFCNFFKLKMLLFFADGVAPTTLPSPGSSIRDGAQRVLQLCQKSEWPPLDQALKVVEKLVAAGGDDVTSTPLAGVVDQVIRFHRFSLTRFFRCFFFPTVPARCANTFFFFFTVKRKPGVDARSRKMLVDARTSEN